MKRKLGHVSPLLRPSDSSLSIRVKGIIPNKTCQALPDPAPTHPSTFLRADTQATTSLSATSLSLVHTPTLSAEPVTSAL